jgi:hypothetical protein
MSRLTSDAADTARPCRTKCGTDGASGGIRECVPPAGGDCRAAFTRDGLRGRARFGPDPPRSLRGYGAAASAGM